MGKMKDWERPAVVAGSFYPSEPEELRQLIAGYLDKAGVATGSVVGKAAIRGFIAPHAGYAFSGALAGRVFSAAAKMKPQRIVMIGPAHYVDIQGLALSSATAFLSPIGKSFIDTDAVESLNKKYAFLNVLDEAHAKEHSLEVMLPFIQYVWPDARILPIVTGKIETEKICQLLDRELQDTDLLLISSDLSHFHSAIDAQKTDLELLDEIVQLDFDSAQKAEACGLAGILAVMKLAKIRNWKSNLIGYAHSGQSHNDQERVVGYGAVTFADEGESHE